MPTEPGDHFYKDVREQQRGFQKFTGGAGGMRLATIMIFGIVVIGLFGMMWYFISDRTTAASSPSAITTGQSDQSTIPAPRDKAR